MTAQRCSHVLLNIVILVFIVVHVCTENVYGHSLLNSDKDFFPVLPSETPQKRRNLRSVRKADDIVQSTTASNRVMNLNEDGHEKVYLLTPYGNITLWLLPSNAPETVAAIRRHADAKGCESCNFYRAERRPPQHQPEGPPYGLLQGEFGMKSPAQQEGSVKIREGHVVFIPDSPHFYISLTQHSDWGGAHTVFAEVKDLSIVDVIAAQWTHPYIHPQYEVPMQMMDKPVYFKISATL